MKIKAQSSIITLSKQGYQNLGKVLSEPYTPQQKKSLKQSIGVYSFYHQRWQKKK